PWGGRRTMGAAEVAVEVGEVLEAAGVAGFGDGAVGLAEEFAGVAEADVVERLGEATTGSATVESAKGGGAWADASGQVGLEDGVAEVSDKMTIDGVDLRFANGVVLGLLAP